MKVCAFSDMHGNLDFTIVPCDLVLICGDIIPLKVQESTYGSERWLKHTFIPWCNKLPCENVLFIGGNHDRYLDHHGDKVKMMLENNHKISYLNCEFYEYKGKRIFGSPLCKIFGYWHFMLPYETQDSIYSKIIDELDSKIDIMITHDAPYGISDVCMQENCPWADGTHIGNESLLKFINSLKDNAPSILLHGHLHSSNHDCEMLNETEVYNVSLLDENYMMHYKPKYFEL
jgi:Icc-related predicted phosphoesterase